MAVSRSKRQLAEFEQKLGQSNQAPERQRLSDSFLNELHNWQQPLQKVLSRESLVLQQKTGYSAVYRVWQELKFYLVEKVWPVRRVTILPRCSIAAEQAGKVVDSFELYYLFQLGRPLTLQMAVTHVPLRNLSHSMRLTTLTRLESVTKFAEVEKSVRRSDNMSKWNPVNYAEG